MPYLESSDIGECGSATACVVQGGPVPELKLELSVKAISERA